MPYQPWWERDLDVLEGWDSFTIPSKRIVGPEKERWQETALTELRYLTGQDFGHDVEAWRTFLQEHPNIVAEREASGELPPPEPSRFDL